MKTEYSIRNYRCHRQVIKSICEMFPNISISIFSEAFVVKAITTKDYLRNLTNMTV